MAQTHQTSEMEDRQRDADDYLQVLKRNSEAADLTQPIDKSFSPTARIRGLEIALCWAETNTGYDLRERVASAKRILDLNGDGGVLLELAEYLGNEPELALAISPKPNQFAYKGIKGNHFQYIEELPFTDEFWDILDDPHSFGTSLPPFDLITITIKDRDQLNFLTHQNLERIQALLSEEGLLVVLFAKGDYSTRQLNGLTPDYIDDQIYMGVSVLPATTATSTASAA